MGKWHERQPADGDTALHCGHLESAELHWWYYEPAAMSFRRPDGSEGEAQWLVVCENCYQAAGGDAAKVQVVGDAVWEGNEPIIPASN